MNDAYEKQLEKLPRAAFTVDEYEGGKLARSFSNVENHRVGELVRSILQRHRGAWEPAKTVTYAPRLLFTTNGLSVNVRQRELVLNIELAPRKWRQYVCAIDDREFDAVEEAIRHQL